MCSELEKKITQHEIACILVSLEQRELSVRERVSILQREKLHEFWCLWDKEKCLYYRGHCKELFDCTFFILLCCSKKRMIALLKKKSNNAKILSTFCCAMENIVA